MIEEIRTKIKTIVLNTKYKPKANCILKALTPLNINSWNDVQNLPRIGHFCGIDVYEFVSVLNENWDVNFTKPTTRKKEIVEVVTDVVVEENLNGESN